MTTDTALTERPETMPVESISLTPPQKAAIIIGILGSDAAGPILEQFDEASLRRFATAMSHMKRIPPALVEKTIHEFLVELSELDMTVRGGMKEARTMLQDYVAEATLARIMDDVVAPSATNVWQKLGHVKHEALAEFLMREHPQTAAVVLSKLPPEQSAEVLGRIDPEAAQTMVMGITRASTLEPNIVEAIGAAVSADFLENYRGDADFKPEDRIGTIMTYTSGRVRQSVLSFLDEQKPDLAQAVKASMFTFADIHIRVEKRDVAGLVRQINQDLLLKAMTGAKENAPETYEFVLSSVSSRLAEQLREELAEYPKVKIREAEEAQNAILRTVQAMEAAGELKLIQPEE